MQVLAKDRALTAAAARQRELTAQAVELREELDSNSGGQQVHVMSARMQSVWPLFVALTQETLSFS